LYDSHLKFTNKKQYAVFLGAVTEYDFIFILPPED